MIQAQKYDCTVDQTATNGSHVVKPRARKLYTPVDHVRNGILRMREKRQYDECYNLLVLTEMQIERQESER